MTSKWLHFLCCLLWAAPNSSGNPCWRRTSWTGVSLNCDGHSQPLLLLLPSLNPEAQTAWSFSFKQTQAPAHFCCTRAHSPSRAAQERKALWPLFLANLSNAARRWCRSAPLTSCGICTGSSDFVLILRSWDWGLGRMLLAKCCMWHLEMQSANATKHLATGPTPLHG